MPIWDATDVPVQYARADSGSVMEGAPHRLCTQLHCCFLFFFDFCGQVQSSGGGGMSVFPHQRAALGCEEKQQQEHGFPPQAGQLGRECASGAMCEKNGVTMSGLGACWARA